MSVIQKSENKSLLSFSRQTFSIGDRNHVPQHCCLEGIQGWVITWTLNPLCAHILVGIFLDSSPLPSISAYLGAPSKMQLGSCFSCCSVLCFFQYVLTLFPGNISLCHSCLVTAQYSVVWMDHNYSTSPLLMDIQVAVSISFDIRTMIVLCIQKCSLSNSPS